MAVGRKIKPYVKISPLKNLRTDQRNLIRDARGRLNEYKDDFKKLPTSNLAANYQNVFAGADNVYEGANSTMPATVFRTSATSAANGEYYTDAGIAALSGGLGTVTSLVTSHDLFTLTIGGNSVTASITPYL